MADNEFEIKAKLTADTKGAKEATQALKEVKKSVDEVTQSTNHTTGDDTFERYAKSAQKAKSQFLELKAALKAMREELSAMGDDPYAKANLGTIADFEKLMPQKSAFSSQNVVELDEATRKVKELTQAFDQLMDTGRQMTVDPSAEVEKVIKAHEKRIDAAEKAYDREEKASAKAAAKSAADEEQKRLAAEKYFSSYMNGQKRIAATLQELQAEYGKYIQKLNEARAAGDRDGAKDAIANLRQLKSQMASVERQAETYNRRMLTATRRFAGMAAGAMNAASALSGLNGTMGTLSRGLSNIASGALVGGIWGAAAGAVSTGLELVVQKINEKSEQIKQEAEERVRGLNELSRKVRDEQANFGNAAASEHYDRILENTLQKHRDITEELKRQLGYIQKKIDLESGFADDEAEIQRLGVEEDYINGKISRGERDRRLSRIDLESGKKRRAFEEKKAQAIVDTAQKARDNAQKAYDESVNQLDRYSDDRVLGQGEASRLEKMIEGRKVQMKELQEQMTSDSQISYLTGLLEESEKYYGVDSPQYRSIRDKIADRRLQFLKPIEVMHGQNLEDQGKLDRSDEALRDAGLSPGYSAKAHDTAIGEYWNKYKEYVAKTDEARKMLDKAEIELNDSMDSLDLLQRRNESRGRVDEVRYNRNMSAIDAYEKKELQKDAIEDERKKIEALKKKRNKIKQLQHQTGKDDKNSLAEGFLDRDLGTIGQDGLHQLGNQGSKLSELMSNLRKKGQNGRINTQDVAELKNMFAEWEKELKGKGEGSKDQKQLISRVSNIMQRFIAATNNAQAEGNKALDAIDAEIKSGEERIERMKEEMKPKKPTKVPKRAKTRKAPEEEKKPAEAPVIYSKDVTGETKVVEITDQADRISRAVNEQKPLDISSVVSGVMNLANTVVQKVSELQTSSQSAIDSAGSQIASLNDAVSKLDASLKMTNKTAERADRTATQLMNWKKFNSRV